MPHRFATFAGTQVHYEERGEGTPVILLHAGIGDLEMWDDQMCSFGRRHRVVRYDQRGKGRTEAASRAFSDDDDLLGLLEHLDIERTALVGCSGGGAIALDFALAHPEMVRGLVLVGSGLGGYDWTSERFADDHEAMRSAFHSGALERAAELWTRVWVDGPTRTPDDVDPAVRARARAMILRSMRSFTGQGEDERYVIDPPAIERLADVRVPTLVIVGEHDVPDIHTIGRLLHDGIPGADLVEVADVGHLMNMEEPARFDQIVLEFLE